MFKNRALHVQVVKNQPSNGTHTPQSPALNPEQINEIAKDQIQAIAVSVGAVLIAGFMASATKDIAVHTAKTKIK